MASARGDVFLIVCVFVSVVQYGKTDTPANCTYNDLLGSWTFYIGKGGNDRSEKCLSTGPIQSKIHVTLKTPDVAIDEFGNKGFWTLIYNQGFEVVIHGRKYFAFSKYEGKGDNATSFCDQTMPGWSHDVLGHDWACFEGRKKTRLPPKRNYTPQLSWYQRLKSYRPNPDFIRKINEVQKSWTAVHYQKYETMTLGDLMRRAGSTNSLGAGRPKPARVEQELHHQVTGLPDAFDWRDVNGVNYVSPVRNQGSCGSCYAFASMAMNEARLRIESNNTVKTIFSPQDIVDCSEYSQGCDGGFPYLIGGKYAEDFGLVEESCSPYRGEDGQCTTPPSCPRHYSTHYRYVGGYYGACNEEHMRLSLVRRGPLVVAFEVYDDFFSYKGGIYHHTGLRDSLNPFELTNHAVTLVGYGQQDGVKYWIVKNSWGDTWGENGYFRILRGVDECSIESIAVESSIIL